ncbi:MAG: hypothetical protein ABIH46_08965 [Chloroflexota bacterium]
MSVNEKVLQKIGGMEQRADERTELWQTIISAFDNQGADGVSDKLEQQMKGIKGKFDILFNKLNSML